LLEKVLATTFDIKEFFIIIFNKLKDSFGIISSRRPGRNSNKASARDVAAYGCTGWIEGSQSCRGHSLSGSTKSHREEPMRLIFGMILGAALTVAGAYISDSMNAGSPTARPMVNWDVVSKNMDGVTEFVRESWKKIVG
jgi:hypothetical protein